MMHEIERRRWRRGAVGLLGAVALVLASTGCSEDAAENGRIPTMIQARPSASAEFDGRNRAPIVEGITLRPTKPSPRREVRASAVVSDPDGDPTTVTYRWEDDDGILLGTGHTLDTRGLEPGDRVEVFALASDGNQESESFSQRFRLAEASLEIALVVIDTNGGTAPGALFEAVVEVTDESRRYETLLEWRVNGEVAGSEGELDTTAFSPGDVVELRARLETEDGVTRPVTGKPVALARGEVPEILSEPHAGVENGLFRYQLRARSNAEGAKLSYELLKGPDGMTVDAKSGVVLWRPTTEQRGRFDVEVAVKDQWGSGVAQFFALQADAPGQPPAASR